MRRYTRTRRGTFRRKVRVPSAKTHTGFALRFILGTFLTVFTLYAVVALQPVAEAAEGGHYFPAVRASEANVGPTKMVMPEVVEVRDMPITEVGKPSQYQKDSAAIVCLERFKGAEASQCWKDLLAISFVESRWNDHAIGDGGKSFGPYQVYTNVHRHVTWEQATNFRWAAKWTLDRLVHYGYPKERNWSLGSHNSLTPNINARYSAMVREVAERIN